MTPRQVDPEQVKAYLAEQAKASQPAVDSPADTVVNLDELKAATDKANEETAASHENIDEDRNKNFEPDKTSLAHLSAWAIDRTDLKVKVTEQDKALYLKSLLNDTALELPVALEIGLNMTFRALTNFDMEVVFMTLQKYSNEDKIVGPAQYASKVQQCAAALQLIKYADLPTNYVKFDAPRPCMEAAIKALSDYIENVIAEWDWPKWQAVVTGLRIFETKLAICNENSRNGNFWLPADAS